MTQVAYRRYPWLFQIYNNERHIFILSFMVMFWALFDSIMSYITPIVITGQGFSDATMGLIYASSSVTGAIFDFFVSRIFKNIHYRRVFLVMFMLCMIYPLLLWQAKTIWLFFLTMGVWGIYWDLFGFGTFDFISRYSKGDDNSKNFGILYVFRSFAVIIGLLIVGVLIGDVVTWKVFGFSWLFLIISLMFFGVLLFTMRKVKPLIKEVRHPKKTNLLIQVGLWKKVGKKLLPIIFLTFFIFFMEAFFWTISPIFSEVIGIEGFGGFLLIAYTLPGLITGWFIGSITKKFGKKRSAIIGLLISSFILSFFSLIQQPSLLILLTFASGLFIHIALPAVNGAYADYISEANNLEGEIEGLEDFSFNLGYILGPLLAGLFSGFFGIANSFSILGIIGIILALLLLKFTPRHMKLTN